MIISTRPFIVVLGVGLLASGLTTAARQETSPRPPVVPNEHCRATLKLL